MFYLRKYHFLLDFCWSSNVYKPLLKFCIDNGVSPNKVIDGLIDFEGISDPVVHSRMVEFWEKFDTASRDEWFDTDEEIEAYFAVPENFKRLLNQEFEKLHILFSVVIFKDYKSDFNFAIRDVAKSLLPANML